MKVKLVRDNIAKIAPPDGTDIAGRTIRPANGLEGKHILLCAKLHEEAAEIVDDPKDPAEYADLLEVMEELARINGVSWRKILSVKKKKHAERGGFRKGLVMVKK